MTHLPYEAVVALTQLGIPATTPEAEFPAWQRVGIVPAEHIPHTHTKHVPDCFRCDLSRIEAEA